jgi:uncharacterized protein YndB with AHSA1/START domain
MTALAHELHRSIVVRATPERVFSFLSDSPRWAAWWGPGSTIDAQPAGTLYIRYPNGIQAKGAVVEVHPGRRIAFTFGYVSGTPIPVGASRVMIDLGTDARGTRLHLLHQFADAAACDAHVQGWRFQLSLLSNAVANEAFGHATAAIDEWFQAWSIPEEGSRADAFARVAAPDVAFRDRFSVLDGVADLTAHAGAAQRFMNGIQTRRRGDIRHCQGTVLADWFAAGPDGVERMTGTTAFVFRPDGRIESVTGFANP